MDVRCNQDVRRIGRSFDRPEAPTIGWVTERDHDLPAERVAELVGDEHWQVIDVREPHEREAGHIGGTRHVELERLTAEAQSIDKERPVVFYCRVERAPTWRRRRSGPRDGRPTTCAAGSSSGSAQDCPWSLPEAAWPRTERRPRGRRSQLSGCGAWRRAGRSRTRERRAGGDVRGLLRLLARGGRDLPGVDRGRRGVLGLGGELLLLGLSLGGEIVLLVGDGALDLLDLALRARLDVGLLGQRGDRVAQLLARLLDVLLDLGGRARGGVAGRGVAGLDRARVPAGVTGGLPSPSPSPIRRPPSRFRRCAPVRRALPA